MGEAVSQEIVLAMIKERTRDRALMKERRIEK